MTTNIKIEGIVRLGILYSLNLNQSKLQPIKYSIKGFYFPADFVSVNVAYINTPTTIPYRKLIMGKVRKKIQNGGIYYLAGRGRKFSWSFYRESCPYHNGDGIRRYDNRLRLFVFRSFNLMGIWNMKILERADRYWYFVLWEVHLL